MKQTVTHEIFVHNKRLAENFSYNARIALLELFEELEDGSGIELEFDPVGICDEWREATPEEFAEWYGETFESTEELESYLSDHTTWQRVDGGTYIFMAF